ncbi:MAG: hypothetical protein CVT49_10785 [candidate division Zixibacteria bacterium HGW-Zixibacteria-1]|nr:MAG: hypothetical protein CVT49_10785 [candidate division Zixibacteria bacterium HGW-Zixibacteria-1]
MFARKHVTLRIAFFAAACGLLFNFAVVRAQALDGDSGLVFGPHEIGFMTIEKYDYTRSFMPKYDYDGQLLSEERARPIQVCIWYPAAGSSEAGSMVYGEYVYPYPNVGRFNILVAGMQARELNYLAQLTNNNRAMVQDFMNLKMKAVKDAPYAQGKFPLIIYHANSMAGFSENLVLCELLASHGYVVATTHSMGVRVFHPQPTEADIEAMTRDKEFVYSIVRDMGFVDRDKLGLLGIGFGGLTALIMQMRNKEGDAVAVIEGSFISDDFMKYSGSNPNFIYNDMSVPMMLVFGKDQAGHDLSVLDSLKYSDRYILACDGMTGNDFSHAVLFASQAFMETTPRSAQICTRYGSACRTILEFFEAVIGKNADKLRTFKDGLSDSESADFTFMAGLDLPPLEAEFVNIIRNEGSARGVELFEKFRLQDPDYRIFREVMMNALGYEMLQSNRLDDAVQIFRLNTIAYPNSANCWDSYADALTASGDNDGALKCYEQVMKVLPGDTAIDPGMKEIILNNARDRLGLNQEQGESN